MDNALMIVAAAVVVVALIAAGLYVYRRQQSNRLRQRFGPEYDRALERHDDRRTAERELDERRQHRERLDIRPLAPVRREHYLGEWRSVQSRFVDEPAAAVAEAHRLIQDVMRDRGYPVEDFEQRAADVSVDHPDVIEDYRVAHDISSASDEGRASTEDLREAMVRYRELFSRLLETRDSSVAEGERR